MISGEVLGLSMLTKKVRNIIPRISILIITILFIFLFSAFCFNKNLSNSGYASKYASKNVTDNLRDDSVFKWTYTENWDKIYVSDSRYPKYKVEIKDKRILKASDNFWGFFRCINIAPDMPNGYQSDVEHYIYEFVKGNKKYKVDIVGVDCIEFDKVAYKVDANVYYLGKAFLPFPRFIRTDSVLNKIYESGCMIGKNETYILFDSFRIRGFSNYIQDGLDNGEVKILKSKPKNTNEILDELEFYYYSQKIVMDVYDSYVSVKDGKKTIWYKIKSGENFLTILSAG